MTARLGKFTKDPDERKRYTIDYDAWLDAGELISSVTYAVTLDTTPALSIESSQVSVDGRSVSFFVAGGVDDGDYDVHVTMTSDGGQIKEDVVRYNIRAL